MSEIDERKVDEMVKEWREVGADYSPVLNRLLHMTDAEAHAAADGGLRAEQLARAMKCDCTCAPRGFVSTPRAVKEQMRLDHIKAGVHSIGCPMWVDKTPMYSRPGDSPSYTLQQRRRDEEAEAVDYRRGPGRFRQAD